MRLRLFFWGQISHERSRRTSRRETVLGIASRPTASWSPEGAELHGTGPPCDHPASAQTFPGDPRQDRGGIAHHSQHVGERKSTRLNSSHGYISYAVFCLKKKKEHTSELQSRLHLVCRLLLEKKKKYQICSLCANRSSAIAYTHRVNQYLRDIHLTTHSHTL